VGPAGDFLHHAEEEDEGCDMRPLRLRAFQTSVARGMRIL
jgi:hypothetical protein